MRITGSGTPALAMPALLGALALALGPCVPRAARADGGLVGWYDYQIYERAQLVFIGFDPEAGRETLTLSAGFETTATDFAWIVPVPALPELAEAPELLFVEAGDYTDPIRRGRSGGCACSAADGPVQTRSAGDVTVYEARTVGLYDTHVVGAEDTAALVGWLEAHGYLGEANREPVTAALQYYVEKSWYFVAMRIDSTAFEGHDSAPPYYGNTHPIRLAFDAEQAILPMRISAISTVGSAAVYLFVCAPHRMTFNGATTEYANRIGSAEMDYLRRVYPALAAHVGEGSFLTRLRVDLPAAAMTGDIDIVRAANDEEFRRISYSALPWFELLLLGGGGLATHLRRVRLQRRARIDSGRAGANVTTDPPRGD